jgi:predicted nucleic acid-binding protein
VIVISDTNILSSFAAGDAFSLLLQLFSKVQLHVPPSVQQELEAGIVRGQVYLQIVIQAIDTNQITVLALSEVEQQLLTGYPVRLNQGEREAIALTETRQATLLSNDNRAIQYCRQQRLRVVSLVDVLRLLWVEHIVSQEEVQRILAKMQQVENLVVTPAQQQIVFAPRRRSS